MTDVPESFYQTSPLYAVLFSSEQDITEPFTPFLVSKRTDSMYGDDVLVTVPHSLSRAMASALPGLWYCLHLPNTFLQLTDMPFSVLENNHSFALDHQLFFAPVQIFNKKYVTAWPPWVVPTLAVCTDDILDQVRICSEDLGFPIEPTPFSALSDSTLRAHWRAIYETFGHDAPYLGSEPNLTRRLDLSPTSLPTRWLLRQMSQDIAEDLEKEPVELVRKAQWYQAALAAHARLEREEVSQSQAAQLIEEAFEREVATLRIPVTLGLPGVAASYSRQVYSASVRSRIEPILATDDHDTWSVAMDDRRDSMIERSAIELVTAHHALARTGLGLMLESVPQEAFTALAELERHFLSAPNGPGVSRLLARLDDAARPIWTNALTEAVAGASHLTVFSNFPIGLLTYPGDTSPLSTRLPIAYQPLNPLSRTMQSELTYTVPISLAAGFHVIVAESISADDPVGAMSRLAWQSAREFIASGGYPITFDVLDTPSIASLNAAISEDFPDVLVISAHGAFRPKSNLAGLVIGDEICLGPELGDLPPVVILSACHVAPKGVGPVSITDLILRQGALAVLGTQVPVDVRHNAILLARFFLYLAETLAKRESFSTLLDAWHFVQMSNAVNDVLNGSPSLSEWGLRRHADGGFVLEEFMQVKSAGQIRRGHVYSDTERILAQIASEQGIGDRVRNWFRRPGYVPETLFYVMAGKPERVYLSDPGMTAEDDRKGAGPGASS